MKEQHGMTNTRIYSIWCKMKERCNNPNNKKYQNYGGRGISVCDEWNNSFLNFYNDMIDSYSDDLTIDRIDVNGNYEKSNCKWSTLYEQSLNKTYSVKFLLSGKSYNLSEACSEFNISWRIANRAFKNGFTPHEIFIDKIDTYTTAHWVELNGERIHFEEACRKYHVNEKTARKLLKEGLTHYEIFIEKKYKQWQRKKFELNGEQTYLAKACRDYGVTEKVATTRLNKGFTTHQIFITKEAL